MHLILTGATGRVGSAALNAMIRNPDITHVSILTRSPVPQATDSEEAKRKCEVIIHSDFAQPPADETLTKLVGAKGCVWAQGISITSVSREMYDKITYDYPTSWAKHFAQAKGLGEEGKFNFVYVSGEGASTEPRLWTPAFGKVKGRAEKDLLELSKLEQFKRLRIFSPRPGGVDNTYQPEIHKYTLGKSTGVMRAVEMPLMPLARALSKNLVSPTKELGNVLVDLAAGDGERIPDGPGVSGEGRTLSNIALRYVDLASCFRHLTLILPSLQLGD